MGRVLFASMRNSSRNNVVNNVAHKGSPFHFSLVHWFALVHRDFYSKTVISGSLLLASTVCHVDLQCTCSFVLCG